jgi:hypothetical protein
MQGPPLFAERCSHTASNAFAQPPSISRARKVKEHFSPTPSGRAPSGKNYYLAGGVIAAGVGAHEE